MPIDLGSLGGSHSIAAFSINNHGRVVGASDLSGDATAHAFLWSEEQGMQDLGTLPFDIFSIANSINDSGQVAAASCDVNFNCRAAIWQNGVMTDLNRLIPADAHLFLLLANSINSSGQIVGAAIDESTNAIVPFLAKPSAAGAETEVTPSAPQFSGSPNSRVISGVRQLLKQRLHFGRVRIK